MRKVEKLLLDASYLRTKCVKTLFDVFISAVDLLHIVDAASAVCTEGSNQQSDASANVGTCHTARTELMLEIVSNDHRAVRIAEDNLCAHVDEFVSEEETALKHLLMEKHTSLRLRSHHDENRKEVGGKTGQVGS